MLLGRLAKGFAAAVAVLAVLPAFASAATITPNINTDDTTVNGNCTLREAVQSVDNGTYVDACATFATGLPLGTADTISLTQNMNLSLPGDEDANAGGDLDVTAPLTITSNSTTARTINQTCACDRVIQQPGGTSSLTLTKLNITGGNTTTALNQLGGGIMFQVNTGVAPPKTGTLTLSGTTVTGNTTGTAAGVGQGGGIYAAGGDANNLVHVALTNSSAVTSNHAGGGAANHPGEGGGIFLDGPNGSSVTSSASAINGNNAGGGGTSSAGQGGGVSAHTATPNAVVLFGGTVSNNMAGTGLNNANFGLGANPGGGVYIEGGGGLNTSGGTVINANESGGGSGGAAGLGGGVAIANATTASSIQATTLSSNIAGDNGGAGIGEGGALYSNSDDVNVTGGTMSDNVSTAGGAMLIDTAAALSVAGTTFTNNIATGNAGAIFDNSANDMTIQNATFTGNNASGSGGAIETQNGGTDTIYRTTMSDNTASGASETGGAIFGGSEPLIIDSSTLNGNHATSFAAEGGAVSTRAATTIVNSTIDGNDATGLGSKGGGVFAATGSTVAVKLSTITGNTANNGPATVVGNGGNLYSNGAAGQMTLTGSAIADGVAGVAATSNCGGGLPASGGYNFEQTTNQCGLIGTGDVPSAAALQLGPLTTANGGPVGGVTATRLPALSSPLVDHIPAAACTPLVTPDTDQRGIARPQDNNSDGIPACESGSVEILATSTPVITGSFPPSGSNNNTPSLHGSADLASTVSIYTSPTCTGTPVVSGLGSSFAGGGLAVSVPDNSTTTFYANASGSGGISPCSGGFTYQEITPPAVTPTPNPPAKKKCKKPKKLNKKTGKCKKKKKKK